MRRSTLWSLLLFSVAFNAVPAVRAETAVGDPPPGDYHARSRAVIEEVLAGREFAEPGGTSWADRVLDRLAGFFRRLPGILEGLPAWLGMLLIVWMVLALVAILIHILYVISGLVGDRKAARSDATSAAACDLYGVVDLDPESVHAEAHRRLEQRDWNGAVRFLYVAAILRLDRAGIVRLRQSKTNHDYVCELAARPDCRAPFEVLTRCFETSFYGKRAANEAVCFEMTAQMDALTHA